MPLLVSAICIGIIAGLRTATPLAAVSWAARLGFLSLGATHLAFLGSAWAPWLFTVLALGELTGDKLPSTPSRKAPAPFIGRVVTGAFAAAVLAIGSGAAWLVPALVGAIGAVIGTLGGAALRGQLAALFGKDLPAALLEDAIAVGSSVLLVSQLR